MTRNQTPHSRQHDQGLDRDRRSAVLQCLVEEFEDWDAGGGVDEGGEVLHAGEHCDAVAPTRDKPNSNRPHNRDRDRAFRTLDFVCEVRGAV